MVVTLLENSYCSGQSLSRKTVSSSSLRNHSDDLRRNEPLRHQRGSDRKYSEELDYEQHAYISNAREKQNRKSAFIDHDSYRYWSEKDQVRKRKLESRGSRSDEMNIHEIDPDEIMHENDLDSYHHECSRSRKHREKQSLGAGSKGDGRIEDNWGPLNQSGTAKGIKGPGQQKKMSTSPTDQWNLRGTATYNSNLTGDCSDGERQSPHIYGEESPRSDGYEEFEDGKKRPHTHKLRNSSNWDNKDRGSGEDEHGSESIRDSRQSYRTTDYSSKYHCRKERESMERGESETISHSSREIRKKKRN